ncbi:Adenylylsulfate kinase-domain-containing protein [Pavlovales sp. CCMP2436]|nr:Adenylylsulfate kinase-domain-containing protein [Pavlovales sp. CCMP2436]
MCLLYESGRCAQGRYASADDDDEDFDRSRRPQNSGGMRTPALAFVGGMLAATLMLITYQSAMYKPPPACATATELCPNVKDVLGEVLKGCPTPECPQAKCPTPRCPEPRCPEPFCPKVELPESITKGCPAPDVSKLVAEHRQKMLQHVGANIIECAPGKDCRGDRKQKFKRLGQQGVTLWFTGLSGAGKTTITEQLEKELIFKYGKTVYRIDGDNLRTGLTKDLGFSPSDRTESPSNRTESARGVLRGGWGRGRREGAGKGGGRRTCTFVFGFGLGLMCRLISGAGNWLLGGEITLLGKIAYGDGLDQFRMTVNELRAEFARRKADTGLPFLETYLDVPLDVLRKRDPKGLYKKVDAGLIKVWDRVAIGIVEGSENGYG